MVEPQGLVQVYTGEGKGKTTAAFGLALRAAGQGLKVCIIQFMKSAEKETGEFKAVHGLSGIEILRFGGSFVFPEADPKAREGARKSCQEALSLAREKSSQEDLDVLILDEINVALSFGFIDLNEVLKLIFERPPNLEMVLTGRGAPQELIEAADLVTEMRMVKHPFQKEVVARRGIEY